MTDTNEMLDYSTCDECGRKFPHEDPGPDHCGECGGCLDHCSHLEYACDDCGHYVPEGDGRYWDDEEQEDRLCDDCYDRRERIAEREHYESVARHEAELQKQYEKWTRG